MNKIRSDRDIQNARMITVANCLFEKLSGDSQFVPHYMIDPRTQKSENGLLLT